MTEDAGVLTAKLMIASVNVYLECSREAPSYSSAAHRERLFMRVYFM
jgi:hypothetical protein